MKLISFNTLVPASALMAAALFAGPAQAAVEQPNTTPVASAQAQPTPQPRPAAAGRIHVAPRRGFEEARNRSCTSLLCSGYIIMGIGF